MYAYHNLESHQKNKSSWRAIIGKTPVFSYLRNSSDSHLFTFFWFLWHLLLNTLFSLFVWSLACPFTSNKMFDCKVWSLLPGMVQKQIKNEFFLDSLFNCLYLLLRHKNWAVVFNKLTSLQCHNGHTLCSTCKTRVHNRCPTCRQELGDIRCLALEKVAESLELPCKYYSLGCPEIFPYYSKLKHEAVCNFRPYNCPYAGSECSVVGDIPFLVSHLRDDHKVDMHTGCTFNHRYVKSNPREVENATWMLTVSAVSLFKIFNLDLFSLQV